MPFDETKSDNTKPPRPGNYMLVASGIFSDMSDVPVVAILGLFETALDAAVYFKNYSNIFAANPPEKIVHVHYTISKLITGQTQTFGDGNK